MTSYRGSMFLGAALILGGAAGVNAADLYGGGGSVKDTYVAPMPSRGPSFYFRLDGTYSSYDRPDILVDNVAYLNDVDLKSAWGIGGGVGMYFFRNIRGDLTWDHSFASDVTGTAGANIIGATEAAKGNYIHSKSPYKRDLFLANLYYDFDMGGRFTPYVGGGIGFVRNNVGAGTLTQDNTGLSGTVDSHTSTRVAGALMTGFSVQLTGGHSTACCASVKDAPVVVDSGRGLMLDVGYRFLFLGDAKTGDTHFAGIDGDPVVEDLHAHEVRVGLRYNLQ